MENNRRELNQDELELVNGGWDTKRLWNDIRKLAEEKNRKEPDVHKPVIDPKKIFC
jgi:hypothetical protein